MMKQKESMDLNGKDQGLSVDVMLLVALTLLVLFLLSAAFIGRIVQPCDNSLKELIPNHPHCNESEYLKCTDDLVMYITFDDPSDPYRDYSNCTCFPRNDTQISPTRTKSQIECRKYNKSCLTHIIYHFPKSYENETNEFDFQPNYYELCYEVLPDFEDLIVLVRYSNISEIKIEKVFNGTRTVRECKAK